MTSSDSRCHAFHSRMFIFPVLFLFFRLRPDKFFMAYNRVLRMYDDELLNVFKRCKELGALAQVHAENGDMVDAGQQDMVDAGILGPEAHGMSRPAATEAEATHRAIAIAGKCLQLPLLNQLKEQRSHVCSFVVFFFHCRLCVVAWCCLVLLVQTKSIHRCTWYM